MKPELDRELKIYLKQIKTFMPFCGKEEKSFIQDLRQNIEDYIEAHPDCTWDEVAEQFETPQEAVFG